jgi:hypothetical protein
LEFVLNHVESIQYRESAEREDQEGSERAQFRWFRPVQSGYDDLRRLYRQPREEKVPEA